MEVIDSILLTGPWMIEPAFGLKALAQYMHKVQLLEKGASAEYLSRKFVMGPSLPTFQTMDGRVSTDAEGIAKIYLSGTMMEEGFCGDRGIVDMVNDMASLDANPRVHGLILEMNTGGGYKTAGYMLNQAIHEFSKPVITYGHMVGSAAYLAASASDEIIAANRGAEFGSIGVMIQFNKEQLNYVKENILTLYSSLSTKKNAEIRSLIAGDENPFVEYLDVLASGFIEEVKENRNIRDDEVFSGGMYSVKEAMANGLIDNAGDSKKVVEILKRHINY